MRRKTSRDTTSTFKAESCPFRKLTLSEKFTLFVRLQLISNECAVVMQLIQRSLI
jgi:hypothetical protein